VLFPGGELPLHIFEPRYRQMLGDCLAGDRRFGLVYRPEGVEERALATGHVGCVALVGEAVPLPDGRANITVQGEERFALERFVPSPAPYHVGEVAPFEDLTEDRAELGALADQVRTLFDRVAHAARALGASGGGVPDLPEDAGHLSFRIASLIDLDPPRRQALLASASPAGRLRELDRLLSSAVGIMESRAAVHVRARQNGRGPSPVV
jgi:Lon protease-like protein